MRLSLLTVVVLVACGGAATPPDAPATLTAADLVGRWRFEVRPVDRDTVLATGMLVAAGDPIAFTQQVTGRDAVPVDAAFDGDSLMTTSGPYPSSFRAGVMVTTTGVIRMAGDTLHGITTAHYDGVAGADSLARFRVSYTRQP